MLNFQNVQVYLLILIWLLHTYLYRRNISYINRTDSKAKIKIQIPLPENYGNQLEHKSREGKRGDDNHRDNNIPIPISSRKYEELTPFEQSLSKREMK